MKNIEQVKLMATLFVMMLIGYVVLCATTNGSDEVKKQAVIKVFGATW